VASTELKKVKNYEALLIIIFGCQFLLGQKIFAMKTQFFARKVHEAPASKYQYFSFKNF
jgi:hypothetical protein